MKKAIWYIATAWAWFVVSTCVVIALGITGFILYIQAVVHNDPAPAYCAAGFMLLISTIVASLIASGPKPA